MAVLAVFDDDGAGRLQSLDAAGEADGEPERFTDVIAAMRTIEAGQAPRWILADAMADYPVAHRSGLGCDVVTTWR